MSGKKKRSKRSRRGEIVLAVAWYRREEWPKLLALAADRDKLEDTYDEWLSGAWDLVSKVERMGMSINQVDVGIDELVEWCRKEGVPLDAAARSRFAIVKLQQTD